MIPDGKNNIQKNHKVIIISNVIYNVILQW